MSSHFLLLLLKAPSSPPIASLGIWSSSSRIQKLKTPRTPETVPLVNQLHYTILVHHANTPDGSLVLKLSY